MMCFKDKTFCIAANNKTCVQTTCWRFFDDEVQRQADAWWGDMEGGAPIAFSDFSGDCPDFLKPTEKPDD